MDVAGLCLADDLCRFLHLLGTMLLHLQGTEVREVLNLVAGAYVEVTLVLAVLMVVVQGLIRTNVMRKRTV